jgi:ThiF family
VIGVVGCSGTGSFVIEMLARLGVLRLVLVDPDGVEYRNLNRIVGATAVDAALGRAKVDVLAEHVAQIGLGTEVDAVADVIGSRRAVTALAGCDILFGCMDSHDGRRTLNRLAAFYLLPYFDCGVGLEADGEGGINQVCAASHYFQPGASSVLGRRVIRQKRADAEALARDNPTEYAKLRAEKYIEGVEEDRPAVISVNGLAAALSVNELLARLHPYRDDPNDRFASVRLSLSQMHLYTDPEQDEQQDEALVSRPELQRVAHSVQVQ